MKEREFESMNINHIDGAWELAVKYRDGCEFGATGTYGFIKRCALIAMAKGAE